jgi:hypothetical protein
VKCAWVQHHAALNERRNLGASLVDRGARRFDPTLLVAVPGAARFNQRSTVLSCFMKSGTCLSQMVDSFADGGSRRQRVERFQVRC